MIGILAHVGAHIPLFNESMQPTPVVEPAPAVVPSTEVTEPVVEQSVVPPVVPEAPLFNQELSAPTNEPNLNESFYEVPVNVSPVIEETQADNFTLVQQLLSSNNIEYKAYSNENGHCIIIEL